MTAKTMSLFDTDINAAGAVMAIIAQTFPSTPMEDLPNITSQLAADMAYLRKRRERGPLSDADLNDILISRPMVNLMLYRFFKNHPLAPQVHYYLTESGEPDLDVKTHRVSDLSYTHEAPVPIRRPPGRPRLMSKAEIENTVFQSYRDRRNARRRLPRED